jgi:hypothetical protein
MEEDQSFSKSQSNSINEIKEEKIDDDLLNPSKRFQQEEFEEWRLDISNIPILERLNLR